MTGASGFLGSRVVPRLIAGGHEVTALTRSSVAAEHVSGLGATPIAGNLDDAGSIEAAFVAQSPEALVNLASLGFGHAPAIVAAAEAAAFHRTVFISTTAIFTRLNPVSRAERSDAEETIRASALEWTILRPTMIYGDAGDRNLARLLRLTRRTPVLLLPGGGRRLQQPVHVDDVASAVVAALESPAVIYRSYEVAGPEALTLRQMVDEVSLMVGRRPLIIPVPLKPAVAACRIYERVARRPWIRAEQLERLDEDKVFDITPAKQDLGFAPRSFGAGIKEEARLLNIADPEITSGQLA